ncbi:MAG: RecQ family ATP-dependent DNA helicase [Gammaproteobacteria bacterium]|nr:RecQ family ATP-dependent DNA helicase [Gammaproteobacteria bacterium]
MDNILQDLQQYFGYDEFRPGQQQVIQQLLSGHSAAAVFPTGGGKSLCYQLPALSLPGITLVVSPLIALMKDQIDALAKRGVNARRLDSSLSADEYRDVMSELRHGSLKLLYVAPERFNNERFRESLLHINISLFAVDEAHCISEWGHNFRPDYLKLADFAQQFKAERILALTATATPSVLDDICRQFDITDDCAVRTGFYRPNLTLETTVVSSKNRDQVLLDSINRQPPGATIIYVTQQKTTELLAQQLVDAGLPARAYHAGLKTELRNEVQEWFMTTDVAIVVATIAFGMGVDKANIRSVYHYNLPKSLENYSQEIGRAGRDGLPSNCHMLACADDLNVLENFIYGDTPDESSIFNLIESFFAQNPVGEELEVSLYSLSSEFDIRSLVLRTLLTYLELEGYLQGGTPFYADYSFKPLLSSQEILQRFDGERKIFVGNMFRQAIKGKIWYKLNPATAAIKLGTNRERIITALDWLGEQQLLEVKVAGVRQNYRILRQPESTESLSNKLFQRFQQRELAEINRLQQVLDLVSMHDCQTNALAAHFGELRQSPCGHCSSCNNDKRKIEANWASRKSENLNSDLWGKVEQLAKKQSDIFTNPNQLTRFLCGISSPLLSRHKLTKHELFGITESSPFADVLQKVKRISNSSA